MQITFYKNNDNWIRKKSKYITATDIPIILGFNKYKTVKSLFEDKKKTTREDLSKNAFIYMGLLLESAAFQMAKDILKIDFILNDGTNSDGKAFYHIDEYLIGATPDGIIDSPEEHCLLEIKTTQPKNYYKWRFLPPTMYLAQLYFQLICTYAPTGFLAIMSTNLAQNSTILKLPMSIFKIKRDIEIDNYILEEVKRAHLEQEKFKVDKEKSKYYTLKIQSLVEKVI